MRRRMARRWAGRAILLLIALLLGAACRRSGDAQPQQPAAIPPAPLSLMAWPASPAENERLQQLADQFNAQNPTTPVTLTLAADYDAALQARLDAADPPDVFALAYSVTGGNLDRERQRCW